MSLNSYAIEKLATGIQNVPCNIMNYLQIWNSNVDVGSIERHHHVSLKILLFYYYDTSPENSHVSNCLYFLPAFKLVFLVSNVKANKPSTQLSLYIFIDSLVMNCALNAVCTKGW